MLWFSVNGRTEIFGYVEMFYNRTRRYSYLGGVSPQVLENAVTHALWVAPKTCKATNVEFPVFPIVNGVPI
jgi:hypothetical protein